MFSFRTFYCIDVLGTCAHNLLIVLVGRFRARYSFSRNCVNVPFCHAEKPCYAQAKEDWTSRKYQWRANIFIPVKTLTARSCKMSHPHGIENWVFRVVVKLLTTHFTCVSIFDIVKFKNKISSISIIIYLLFDYHYLLITCTWLLFLLITWQLFTNYLIIIIH